MLKKGEILVCVTNYYHSFTKGEYYPIYDLIYKGPGDIYTDKVIISINNQLVSVSLCGPIEIDGKPDWKSYYDNGVSTEYFITLSEWRSRKLKKILDEN